MSAIGSKRRALVILLSILALPTVAVGLEELPENCERGTTSGKQLLWGDLHVHTGYSLDAYGYGQRLEPADAYRFARGEAIPLMNTDREVRLDRPLDFAAVTDHAETFDLMQICALAGEPSSLPYCRELRENAGPSDGLQVFRDYLLPLIVPEPPRRSPICDADGVDCDEARRVVWRAVQAQANAANDPCRFSALIGQEWSATPGARHWHRNLIFASGQVPDDVVDYLRYPELEAMWRALERDCRAEDGCEVLAIPHNPNYEGGGSFTVEGSTHEVRQLRARYERLVEVFQSKGSSECLPLAWQDENPDCRFEIIIPRPVRERLDSADQDTRKALWEALRSGYARNILGDGLRAFADSGDIALNPLQLGLIASTDNHAATAGDVAEQGWHGDAWASAGDAQERLEEVSHYNPGGLVAVWAPRNTRRDIFDALHRREAYGTSGPRIGLRLAAAGDGVAASCDSAGDWEQYLPMGATLPGTASGLSLTILAQADSTPLQRIEVIKGELRHDKLREQVITAWESPAGAMQACTNWRDEQFNPGAPTYWYVRVLEAASPRWSVADCRQVGDCTDYPGADQMIRERTWSSPVWYLPGDANP